MLFAARQWGTPGNWHAYRDGDPVALCNGLRVRPLDPPPAFDFAVALHGGRQCASCAAIVSRGGIQ